MTNELDWMNQYVGSGTYEVIKYVFTWMNLYTTCCSVSSSIKVSN